MTPLRAFLLSFAAGLALLFSGQGLLAMVAHGPDARIGSGPLHIPTA